MVPHPDLRVKKWQEHCPGSTVIKYNHPSGRTSYIYVSASGRKFRSWKQCVRYMGEDTLASVSWKDLSLNGGDTHHSTADANYKFQSGEGQAPPRTLVGTASTNPSSPGEKGSLNGDRCLVQKAQTLNVISSSSSSEKSHGRNSQLPPPSTQSIIAISSSKEQGNQKNGSYSSSSSSSSEKSISRAFSSYGNSALSSSSSEELDDRDDEDMDIANRLIHLRSRPSQDSVEKSDVPVVRPMLPGAREENHRSGCRKVMPRKTLPTLQLLTNDVMEPKKDANNIIQSLKLPSKSVAVMVKVLNAHNGAEAASPAREAVCAGKSLCEEAGNIFAAAASATYEPAPETTAECTKKRKGYEGGAREEEQEEGGERLKAKTESNGEAVAEELHRGHETGHETRPCGAQAFHDKIQHENETDSQRDQSSDESCVILKELMWKMFEEAIKRRKSLSSSPKKARNESNEITKRDSNCSCHGPTIIVVCPCSIISSHK